MDDTSWRLALTELLSARGPDGQPLRVAILGVGNDLNADDGAGMAVARAVAAFLPLESPWRTIEGGTAPENTTGAVRRIQPDIVLMVDAVQMDTQAGEIRWIAWDQVDGFSASSHTLPLTILAAYLRQEIACRVELLGVQVQSLELGEPMSEPVRTAVTEIAEALVAAARP